MFHGIENRASHKIVLSPGFLFGLEDATSRAHLEEMCVVRQGRALAPAAVLWADSCSPSLLFPRHPPLSPAQEKKMPYSLRERTHTPHQALASKDLGELSRSDLLCPLTG